MSLKEFQQTLSEYQMTEEQRHIAAIFCAEDPIAQLAIVAKKTAGKRLAHRKQVLLRQQIDERDSSGRRTEQAQRALDHLTYYFLSHVDRLVQEYRGLGIDDQILFETIYDLIQSLIVSWHPPEGPPGTAQRLSHYLSTRGKNPLERMICDFYEVQVNQFYLIQAYFRARRIFSETEGREAKIEDIEELIEIALEEIPLPQIGRTPAEKTGYEKQLAKVKRVLMEIHNFSFWFNRLLDQQTVLGIIVDPEDYAEHALLATTLASSLARLRPIERAIIRMRYGLATGAEMTHAEIAAKLGKWTTQIKPIEDRALHKLRHPIVSKKLRSFLFYYLENPIDFY